MVKADFLDLREVFATFPLKKQIHVMLYQGQKFPVDCYIKTGS